MLQKYDKETVEQIGKTSYYVAISAMQKCVRRGDVTRAVNFAKVGWRMNPHRCFSRLWTILYEDCGRDLPAMLAFFKHRKGGFEFENIVNLIVKLAKATKSRETCLTSYWMKGQHYKKDVILQSIGADHAATLIPLIDAFSAGRYNAYDAWDYGVGNENMDWTIELAERSEKFDWEKFGAASPYWFQAQYLNVPDTIHHEIEGDNYIDGWMPSSAIDCHTRPGKVIDSAFMKHNPASKYPGVEYKIDYGIGSWLFWHDGWKYNRMSKRTDIDIFDIWLDCELVDNFGPARLYFTEQAVESMAKVIEDIQGLRHWVVTKSFKQDFDWLKYCYADQWFDEDTIASLEKDV